MIGARKQPEIAADLFEIFYLNLRRAIRCFDIPTQPVSEILWTEAHSYAAPDDAARAVCAHQKIRREISLGSLKTPFAVGIIRLSDASAIKLRASLNCPDAHHAAQLLPRIDREIVRAVIRRRLETICFGASA